MEHTMNGKKIKKRITTANIINTIYTVLLCFMEISAGVGIKACHDSMAKLMDGVQNADAESYMGGYQVVGGLFGAGAVTVALGILYLVAIVSAFYLVLFLIENIIGYRIASRLKREEHSMALVKKVKRNAVFKCVLALLVIIPGIYVMYSMESFAMLIVIIPQAVVMALAINSMRLL